MDTKNATSDLDDWTAYSRQYDRQKDHMERIVRRIATELQAGGLEVEVWESNAEDYGYQLTAKPLGTDDENGIDLDLTIWDSGSADDGIDGVHGNFHCGINRYGGEVLGGYIPYNYTDEVWADYADDAEWDRRIEMMDASLENAAEFILSAPCSVPGSVGSGVKGEVRRGRLMTYRAFVRSANTFDQFSSARKITRETGLTYDEALRYCRTYNDSRNARQIRRGTMMEFEREGGIQ